MKGYHVGPLSEGSLDVLDTLAFAPHWAVFASARWVSEETGRDDVSVHRTLRGLSGASLVETFESPLRMPVHHDAKAWRATLKGCLGLDLYGAALGFVSPVAVQIVEMVATRQLACAQIAEGLASGSYRVPEPVTELFLKALRRRDVVRILRASADFLYEPGDSAFLALGARKADGTPRS